MSTALVPFDLARFVDTARPPRDGALSPVADGWCLRRLEGESAWQAAPPARRSLARALSATPDLAVAVGTLGSYSVIAWAGTTPVVWGGHLPDFILQVLALGDWTMYVPLAAGMLAHLALRRQRWRDRLVAFLLARGAERARPAARLAGRRAGEVVRVTGIVEPGPTFAAPSSGAAAVLTRTVTRRDALQGRRVDELRGIDFALRLDSGERVSVRVRHAVLLDDPARGGGRSAQSEIALGPGDRVEVAGALRVEPAVDARVASDREARVGFVLAADRRRALLVRRA